MKKILQKSPFYVENPVLYLSQSTKFYLNPTINEDAVSFLEINFDLIKIKKNTINTNISIFRRKNLHFQRHIQYSKRKWYLKSEMRFQAAISFGNILYGGSIIAGLWKDIALSKLTRIMVSSIYCSTFMFQFSFYTSFLKYELRYLFS